MTNATQTLPSQNEGFGFWGTMNEHASAAWPIASATIASATGCEPEQVRAFLDSRFGRHFADEVQDWLCAGSDIQDAVAQTTQRWMNWKISRFTSNEYGIPRDMAYLTGFVVQAAIHEEFFV